MNNPFKKQEKFMNYDELSSLKNKINSRKAELKLRSEQARIENEFIDINKDSKGMKFDPEKLRKGAIIVVVGLALTFIVIKIIGKFI